MREINQNKGSESPSHLSLTTVLHNVNIGWAAVSVQLQTLQRRKKQWDKEWQTLEVDKLVAEIDAHQKDHVIRSKYQLTVLENQLVVEKDSTLCDRLKALQQKVCLLSYLFTYILTYLVLLLLLLLVLV